MILGSWIRIAEITSCNIRLRKIDPMWFDPFLGPHICDGFMHLATLFLVCQVSVDIV